jgi:hypothetical protein
MRKEGLHIATVTTGLLVSDHASGRGSLSVGTTGDALSDWHRCVLHAFLLGVTDAKVGVERNVVVRVLSKVPLVDTNDLGVRRSAEVKSGDEVHDPEDLICQQRLILSRLELTTVVMVKA